MLDVQHFTKWITMWSSSKWWWQWLECFQATWFFGFLWFAHHWLKFTAVGMYSTSKTNKFHIFRTTFALFTGAAIFTSYQTALSTNFRWHCTKVNHFKLIAIDLHAFRLGFLACCEMNGKKFWTDVVEIWHGTWREAIWLWLRCVLCFQHCVTISLTWFLHSTPMFPTSSWSLCSKLLFV